MLAPGNKLVSLKAVLVAWVMLASTAAMCCISQVPTEARLEM